MKYKHIYILGFVATMVALSSCNSSEVIIDDEPEPPTQGGFRPATPTSSAESTVVFEWLPAPGQFINEPAWGIDWPSVTASDLCKIVQTRLEKHYSISLGSFGGYIVVGFDHSIVNKYGDYELGILGNAFNSPAGDSNEPGIVYVMQDTNGNGLPDDTWYELRGSATFESSTIRDYAVTYYKPSGKGQPVRWTDNLGNEGQIAYLAAFHSQDTYYPIWVTSDTYTLTGTRLEAKTCQLPSGNWSNPSFGWGYVDNMGEDVADYDGANDCNRFRISDAIDADGNAVVLDYIDFVKVQTGVLANAGHLGEVSTEVFGVIDLTLKR